MRKKSKQSIRTIQDKLWKLCRELVYIRDRHSDGTISCFTCDAPCLESSNRQLGHGIPSSTCGAFLRYDLRNLHYQCTRCNIWGGGEGFEYHRRLKELHGEKFVKQLFRDKQKIVKAEDHYLMLIEQYEDELKNAF